jgi:hypothetical protein
MHYKNPTNTVIKKVGSTTSVNVKKTEQCWSLDKVKESAETGY